MDPDDFKTPDSPGSHSGSGFDKKKQVALLDLGVCLPNNGSDALHRTRPVDIRMLKEDAFDTNMIREGLAIDSEFSFTTNEILTSRYTAANFVPKNLFEQFQQMTNVYFLIVGLLQIIPEISTTDGLPTIYLPLCFVLAVSAIRSAVEDHYRHVEDRKENERTFSVVRDGRLEAVAAMDIVVGDIVLVKCDEPFPADLMLMSSSHAAGHCFVETSNLDGETNLKVKVTPAIVHEHMRARVQKERATVAQHVDDVDEEHGQAIAQIVASMKGVAMWESPNSKLHQFNGWLYGPFSTSTVPYEGANLLLRGTKLQNSEWVVGLVCYTGNDTKVRRNASKHAHIVKIKSSVIKRVDWLLLGMLGLQVVLCLVGGIVAGTWQSKNDSTAWYLALSSSPLREGVIRFFTWFIILSQFVPISLLVTGEFVKTFQAWFMNRDIWMYHAPTDTRANVRSLTLNEDLGQVEYIFSDKTGTLTQNIMQFRACIIGDHLWGSSQTEISKRVRERSASVVRQKRPSWTELDRAQHALEATEAKGTANYVNFDAKQAMLDCLWGGSSSNKEAKAVEMFLVHMCISNTITPVVDEATGEVSLQSSSPDELSLCSFASYMGFEYLQRNPTTIRINKFGRGDDEIRKYQFLGSLEFNGKRKRVTIVYEHNGNVLVMSKGADATMFPLLKCSTGGGDGDYDNGDNDDEKSATTRMSHSLDKLSGNGLRTLVIASSCRPMEWWSRWKPEFDYVRSLPERGTESNHTRGACSSACRICTVYNNIEDDARLELLGATAIDDQLQALVPECIKDFLAANVKVWMLTGDKLQTAKNIGLACNLIDPDMQKRRLGDWRNSRLVHVTGKWSRLHALKRKELEELYNMFQNIQLPNPSVQSGFIAMFRSLGLAHTVTADHITYAIAQAAISVSADALLGSVTRDQFAAIIRSIKIPLRKAVEADIRRGLEVVRLIGERPISMVVEGAALSVLYPPSYVPKGMHSFVSPVSAAKNKPRGTRQQVEMASPHSVAATSSAKTAFMKAAGSHHDSNDVETNAHQADLDLTSMRDHFFQLGTLCKSVIACRLTPYQKAQMIQEVQTKHRAITLAIGDGANDEPMIRAAHIGVGIAGLEGSAAANAADFSIGQFRFLHSLIFVHGYWNYHRISTMVFYIFFKTVMMRLVMLWFGMISGASGQQFYHEFVAIFYNVAMTALPIMVLATLDQPLSRETLENQPRVYSSIVRAQVFNSYSFSLWILRSIVYSLIIFFVGYYSLGMASVAGPDGCVHGLFYMSTVMYIGVVFIATFRILLEMNTITAIHVFWVVLSAIGSYLVIFIMSSLKKVAPDLYGVVQRSSVSPSSWFTLVLIVAIPMLLGFTSHALQREWLPTMTNILQEKQRASAASAAPPTKNTELKEPLRSTLTELRTLPSASPMPPSSARLSPE